MLYCLYNLSLESHLTFSFIFIFTNSCERRSHCKMLSVHGLNSPTNTTISIWAPCFEVVLPKDGLSVALSSLFRVWLSCNKFLAHKLNLTLPKNWQYVSSYTFNKYLWIHFLFIYVKLQMMFVIKSQSKNYLFVISNKGKVVYIRPLQTLSGWELLNGAGKMEAVVCRI